MPILPEDSANDKYKHHFITHRLVLCINTAAKIPINHFSEQHRELKMKLQLFVVFLAVAGSYALPRANDFVEPRNIRNPVEYRIRRFIERLIIRIDSAGGDPLEVERRDFAINLESVGILAEGFVANLRYTGASDIRINTLDYSYFNNRLRLDVSLPELNLVVGDSGLEANVNGKEIKGQLQGSLSIKSIRIAGVGYVNVDIIGGISLQSVSLNCSIGGIESDLSVVAQGNDQSELVNNLLNVRLPNYLENNKDAINSRLENILSFILDLIWSY